MTPLQVILLMQAMVTLLETASQSQAGTFLHVAIQQRIRDIEQHIAELKQQHPKDALT